MRLSKMKLKNFRCFGPEGTIIEFENLTTIIGANSAGKTAILNALIKMFGNTGDKEITRSDFYVSSQTDPATIQENSFEIEVFFDFPELIDGDENEYAVPIYFESFTVSSPGNPPYIHMLLEAKWESSNDPEGIIEYKFWFVRAVDGEAVTDEHRVPMSKHNREHIKVIYVPAVRDPSTQLKNATGTILWRALKGINWSESDKGTIKEKIDKVDEAFAEQPGVAHIKEVIKNQWKNYHSDTRYTNADMKFGSTDLDSILKKLEVAFTPTQTDRAFTVTSLGDGLRSLFYLSLVDSLLEIENIAIKEALEEPDQNNRVMNIEPPSLSIIMVEEPENHISPHLLGKVVTNLERIASRSNSQTIITSHSPSIVKRVDPSNIRHVRFCNVKESAFVNKILLPNNTSDAFKYVKEAIRAYPELYFSSLVILGEGDSEEIILPKLIELSGSNLDSNAISIIPLGGRHVNHFWKLLKQLNVPFITLLDLDRERYGGGWGRVQYVLKQLIEYGMLKENFLKFKDGSIMSDEALNNMHNNDMDKQGILNLDGWLAYLENNFNVFFSNPLDIDFLMLESFKDFYLMSLTPNEGPYIKEVAKIKDLTDVQKEQESYKKRLKDDIRKTLKSEGGDGSTYTSEQQELMIWYSYFFLSRGKPSTHILGLSKIEDEVFMENIPDIFNRFISSIHKQLELTSLETTE